jgi:protein-disulfide isomerase
MVAGMRITVGVTVGSFLAACSAGAGGDTASLRERLGAVLLEPGASAEGGPADETADRGLDALTAAEVGRLVRVVRETASPCDEVRTIGEDLLDAASRCGRAAGAARFAARRIAEGYTVEDVEAQLIRRYREARATDIDTAGAPTLGPPGAAYTVVVFSDFVCPYCAHAARELARLRAVHPQSVRVVFMHYPLDIHAPEAREAAKAAVAAQNQGRFWEYHDLLFGHQDGLGRTLYPLLAMQLSLDVDLFVRDQASEAAAAVVQESVLEGNRVGVEGTPTIFVNGRRFDDDDVRYLDEWIDEE